VPAPADTDAELDGANGGTFNDDQIVNVLKAALSFSWLVISNTGTLNGCRCGR
jgi:hypothetical protein